MLVDRGLERWRSHDAAAERQKRSDMAHEGHTHRDEDSRKQALRTAEVENGSRDAGRTQAWKLRARLRDWRGADAGGHKHSKGLERTRLLLARWLEP